VAPLHLLDTTLRDGSYAINFQFTAADTALITGELERAGVDLIEVGHGVGLGASAAGKGVAAETDEAYMRAASGLQRARWGMFCIPGIARLEHLDLAADHGMKFVRIGTDVANAAAAEPFVARAKRYNMFVAANFMKSYAMEPAAFAEQARHAQRFGADVLYIVDSAGGMLTRDVERYFVAVRDVCDIPLGFHGHNNLGLAVANTIRAIELGATFVDASLQGLGRSAGNTPTEMLLLVLERHGWALDIKTLEVMDIGEKYIKPLIQHSGSDSVDTIAGYAQFHSSYMGIIREFSSRYRVDPRRLIVALCQHDKVNAPRALVERLAAQLASEQDGVFTARFRFDRYHGAEQEEES
jgi:4-hydroxy 2-oxovalerate aldolase